MRSGLMQRHPTDVVSLVFGLIFCLAGATFLLRDVPLIAAADLRWLAPLLVLLLGAWLLVSPALSARHREPTDDVAAD
jgi:cytochrome c oxidase subunit IV